MTTRKWVYIGGGLAALYLLVRLARMQRRTDSTQQTPTVQQNSYATNVSAVGMAGARPPLTVVR